MKNFFSKNYVKIFVLIISYLFLNCKRNVDHFDYWKNFFIFQDSIKKHLKNENKWEIANGNLNPQKEGKLEKTKTQKLALLWNILYWNTNSEFEIQNVELSHGEKHSTNFENYLLIEYTPSRFNKIETYLFKRVLQYQSKSVYHTTEFLNWIRFFQIQVNPERFFLNSPLGNFLCNVFDCAFELNEKYFIQIFKPNKELKNLDKSFYERITKLLKSKFEISFFENGNQFLKISSQNQNLQFEWGKLLISEYPNQIQIYINFYTKLYGLEIEIQNWLYEFEFRSAGRSSYLKGRFKNIPDYSLKGRLGYILPKQVLNFFIPENINEYMKTFFEMRLRGNNGKGNLWEINIQPYFKYYRITSTIESESPKKVFRFWSTENPQESQEIFEEKFREKLLESLHE